MTKRRLEPVEEKNPAEAFLRSRARQQGPSEPSRTSSPPAGETAEQLAPDRPHGEAFVHQATEALQTSTRFTALVIAVDSDSPVELSDPSGDDGSCRLAVTRVLAEIAPQLPVLWGVLEDPLLGCFLPDADAAAGRRFARQIKQSLADRCSQTMTIGIAEFPCLDYRKDQVLDNARKALEHARFFGPDSLVSFDAISLNISGDRMYDAGDIEGAVEEFKKALALDPHDANIHNSLGVCYGVSGDLPQALQSFTTAIELDPAEPLALYNAGLVSKMTGNRKEALEYFLRADSRPGERYEIALQIGRLYLDMDIPESARAHLERAVHACPDSAPALAALGDCYGALKLTEDAISTYKKALRRNANDAASLSGLGWLYHRIGKNRDIALLFCRQSIDIAPGNGLYRRRLGDLLLQEDRLAEALEQYRKAAELGFDANDAIAEVQNRLARQP
jgi:tetratricopeptide (TPR) repeat protein